MLAVEASITVVDFETTGVLEGYADEPWQIGSIRFEGGHPVPDTAFTSLLRIGDRPFSPYAPGRHDQIREQLKTAPTLQELWPHLRPRLVADGICAHNVAVERKFLRQAFSLQPLGPWIDTLKLIRIAYPALVCHKLEALVVKMDLKPKLDALLPALAPHDALYDATACALLLECLLHLPEWEGLTLEALVHARAPSVRGAQR